MNIRLLLAGLMIFVMFAAYDSSASNLYVDDEGRFSFTFSGDWRKLEKAGEDIDGHFVLARKGKAVAEVIIAHETPENMLSMEEYLDEEKKRIGEIEGHTQINQKTDFKITGYPAAWVLINITEKDVSGRISTKKLSQYFIKKGDDFWGISVITSDEDTDLIMDIQKTIVKSFEFSTGARIHLAPLVKEEIKILFDPHKRYSIRIPESWEIIHTDGLELAIESDIGKMYVFSLQLKDKELTTKEVANDFVVDHEIMSKCHVMNEAPVKLGTEKGHMINYEGEKSGYDFHVQLIVVLRDNMAFYNYFISSPRKWEKNKGLIAAVQYTFSFIKKQMGGADMAGLPEFLQKPEIVTKAVETETETRIDKTPEELSDISAKLLWEPFSKDDIPR